MDNFMFCQLIFLTMSLLANTIVLAREFTIVPSLFISTRNFEYSVFNGSVSGHINSAGGGITGIYRRFYIDIAGERNFTTSEESTLDGLYNDVKFERSDFAASIGYAVNDAISTFLGYKYGKSTLTQLYPSLFAGAKTSLEGNGIFVGAGGGFAVGTWGTLSFSAAYAKMIATYNSFDLGSTDEGDASGTSLRVEWKAPLIKSLYYDLSVIHHSYYYEDFAKLTSDISEEILSIRLGLSYRF
jgi:hypothetical protein